MPVYQLTCRTELAWRLLGPAMAHLLVPSQGPWALVNGGLGASGVHTPFDTRCHRRYCSPDAILLRVRVWLPTSVCGAGFLKALHSVTCVRCAFWGPFPECQTGSSGSAVGQVWVQIPALLPSNFMIQSLRASAPSSGKWR